MTAPLALASSGGGKSSNNNKQQTTNSNNKQQTTNNNNTSTSERSGSVSLGGEEERKLEPIAVTRTSSAQQQPVSCFCRVCFVLFLNRLLQSMMAPSASHNAASLLMSRREGKVSVFVFRRVIMILFSLKPIWSLVIILFVYVGNYLFFS
jgi:hypothetical protein